MQSPFLKASLISNMTKFASMKLLFLIMLLCLQQTFPQSDNIVVITNPEIGLKQNAVNLNEVVEDINKRQNISGLVVIGNITANGKFDEFIWAQEILNQLTVPYFVVGGEKDYLFSEGKGSEISLLWGDDKQFINAENFSLVGINTFQSILPSRKYIDSETLHRLENKITSSQITRLFTFSFYPLNNAENSDQFSEVVFGKKYFSFVGKMDNTNSGKSIFEGFYLNRKDGWGYLLVSTKNDSVFIKKILGEEIKKKIKPEIIKTTFAKLSELPKNKQTSFISAGTKIWSVSFNHVKITSSVSDGENIYSVFGNGLINCVNASGKEIWRIETNKKISIPPLIENDLLVIVSDDGEIHTLNSKTGTSQQIIGIGERITSGISVSDVDDYGTILKSVIAGTEYGNLYCYNLNTLDPIWTDQISDVNSELKVCSDIISSDSKIYFYDDRGTLYCRSAANGMLIWQIDAATGGWIIKSQSSFRLNKNNLIIINKDLLLVDEAGNLFCIDVLLGTVKWNIKNLNANGLIRLDNLDNLILPTTKNSVVVVSTTLRKVASEIELPFELKDETINDVVNIGTKLFVGLSNGWVYKVIPKQKVEKFFRASYAPVISIDELNGNCLVTDYDGNFTLLNLFKK